MLIGLAIATQGKYGAIVDRLYNQWSNQGTSPFLLCRRDCLRDIMAHVFSAPESVVQKAIHALMDDAVDRGEFTALTHDGSFKTLFSILGQENMSQKKGEAHVLHTMMGLTGACPGFSLQPDEGIESFEAAIRERLSTRAINQVRMLFSDAPSEKMLRCLPACLGVAADALHIPLRVEQCTNEKRTACSSELRSLVRKFACPLGVPEEELLKDIYHGQSMPGVSWKDAEAGVDRDETAWEAFLSIPLIDHMEYVAEMKRIVLKYEKSMDRRNSKGVPLRKVLENASSTRNYYYLRNNNVFAQLARGERAVSGTSQNEAEHMNVKRWCRCIWQQHEDRVHMIKEVYALHRMLTNAAQQVPLGMPLASGRISHILSGQISTGALRVYGKGVPRHEGGAVQVVKKRCLLRKLGARVDAAVAAGQLAAKSKRRKAWANHVAKHPLKRRIFRRRQAKNSLKVHSIVEEVVRSQAK